MHTSYVYIYIYIYIYTCAYVCIDLFVIAYVLRLLGPVRRTRFTSGTRADFCACYKRRRPHSG